MATISAADPASCLIDSKSQACPRTDKPTAPLLDADVVKIVERKLRSSNFRILRWSLDSLGEVNGYLGSYYTLSVTVRSDDKSRDLKFFAKTLPPSSSPQSNFILRTNTFNKEIEVYSKVLPSIGRGHGPKWLPDFYYGKNNVIMVLEDAKEEGYTTPDKYVPLDEEHCVCMLKAFAQLHSRSLIQDEKLRRSTGQTILDLYGHLLKEVAFVEEEEMARKYLSSCTTGAATLVDLLESIPEHEKASVKSRLTNWMRNLPKLLQSFEKYRNVMCHRDTWANNIMFKRDSNGKPIGCYLVDFQFLRYSPPAVDFVFCIYLMTDRATRRRCFDSFVRIYREAMRQELASEGLDLEKCIPLAEFVESCEEIIPIAMVYSITNMQIMLLTKEAADRYFVDCPDQLEYVLYGDRRRDLVLSQCRIVKAYLTRIGEIIEEAKDLLTDNPPNC
ncbi:uncharacterized protein LOC143183415 [Calliopsis andreniformis]|uniref:uncharacterized protein LOC143183415 n=1 Tax=Calliopsis andreniformis TaxID=337506 RepID=UPI003FCD3993